MSTNRKNENLELVNETELAAAEVEAENSELVYVHDFGAKPFKWEGKTYNTLTFDFETLTGKDSLAIEQELIALGKTVVFPAASGDFLVRMAARACEDKLGIDAFMSMPIKHFDKIQRKCRSFLMS